MRCRWFALSLAAAIAVSGLSTPESVLRADQTGDALPLASPDDAGSQAAAANGQTNDPQDSLSAKKSDKSKKGKGKGKSKGKGKKGKK